MTKSTNFSQDQGATAYSGEKKEVMWCWRKVKTSTYMITNAIKKRGIEVITNASTLRILSAQLYWRGATNIPTKTPTKVETECANNASIKVLGRRSRIISPASRR